MSDEEFVDLWHRVGPNEMGRITGIGLRNIFRRRTRIEKRIGRKLQAPPEHGNTPRVTDNPGRVEIGISDGEVIVGSDFHLWPGHRPTTYLAFLKFIRERKPSAVILNGDVLDFPTISRYPLGWESHPEVHQELEHAQECLHEIEIAAGRARKVWPLGNHDARFETRIAMAAREYKSIKGVHLTDHFPLWEPCWSCFINDDVVVKHRFRGGIHATHNNVLWAGRTMVTGHLHSAQVRPINDYNGTRYGVDTGCIADANSRAFLYTEDNPKNWRSAFALLTFKGGLLLQPELVLKWDEGRVQFRGELIEVGGGNATALRHPAPEKKTSARKRNTRQPRRSMGRSRTRGVRAAGRR